MDKKIQVIAISANILLMVCFFVFNKEPTPLDASALNEYYDNNDYSCRTDSDCEIKDIHNCCEYDPKCVNKMLILTQSS
jgi:hypothetical protein